MKCQAWLFTSLVLLYSNAALSDISYTTVRTRHGNIRGIINNYGDAQVREFLGIRYAQPPTNALRFAKPQPVLPWRPNMYDALAPGSSCPQVVPAKFNQDMSKRLSEDCLFLNIYAPTDGQEPEKQPLRAVMVFIHGGGFRIGSSSEFTGAGMAINGDVIVVTINYRLNVFGFLSTGDTSSPGNYGLWDQQEALLWMQDNIVAFGGDPSRVTIFGQSAGGASVNYQAISPRNDETIFQRAIVESGSVHSPWAFQYSPQTVATKVAQRLGCWNNESIIVVMCLRSKTVDELLTHAEGFAWAPVADGQFIIDNPTVMTDKVMKGSRDQYLMNFARYDYLVGFNSQEALMFVDNPLSTASVNDVSNKIDGKDVSDGLSDAAYTSSVEEIGKFLFADASAVSLFTDYAKLFYADVYRQQIDTMPPGDKDRLRLFVQIAGDFEIVAPTLQTVKLHALLNGPGKNYLYEYDVKRSFIMPRNVSWEGPEWLRTGADHCDELSSVLGFPYLQQVLPKDTSSKYMPYSAEEGILSKRVIRYWSNYAKTGDPNIGTPVASVWGPWPEYDIFNKQCLRIKVDRSFAYNDLKTQEDEFWNAIVPRSRSSYQSIIIPNNDFAHPREEPDCTQISEENDGLYTLLISIIGVLAAVTGLSLIGTVAAVTKLWHVKPWK